MRARLLGIALASLTLPAFAQAVARPFTLSVFGMAGQGFHQEGQGFAEFGTLAVQAGRSLSRHVQILLELHPLILVRQPRDPPYGERETVEALGIGLGVRWSPAPSTWKTQPYLEVLDGPFYGLRRIPSRGTTFNFLTQAGAGVTLPLGGEWHPQVSFRWVHLSNAGLGAHNPDWDFWALAVGASRRLP